MDARTIDEKNLLANCHAAFLNNLASHGQSPQQQAVAANLMTNAMAAAGFGPGSQMINPSLNQNPSLSLMMNQAQYMTAMLQQNDTSNIIQNSLASGVPTLHIPTIFSYLGYTNSFPQPNLNNNFNNGSGTGSMPGQNGGTSSSSKSSKNNLEMKYGKLLEVVQEIGRDVRPLYTGSKTASDRLRRQINQARHLARECLIEVDRRAQRNTVSSSTPSSSTNNN